MEAIIRSNGHGRGHGSAGPAARIGVFDSGIGGLTVAREIMRQIPGTSFCYVADIAHVPYGPRPAAEIRAFARGIVEALMSEGACALVAACNMSSALALPKMETGSPVPLIGMIRPGARAAIKVLEEGPLGILATEGTCASGAYPDAVAAVRPELKVVQSACPEFVPLVEAGRTEGPEAREAAERYMRPLLIAGCRTVVLGCTHYPWLAGVLRQAAGPGVVFVNPAVAVVEELKSCMPVAIANMPPLPHRFAATAFPDRLEAGVRRWLGLEADAEYWPLWEPRVLAAPSTVKD